MNYEIKHKNTGAVLFAGEGASLREVVERAVRERANLYGDPAAPAAAAPEAAPEAAADPEDPPTPGATEWAIWDTGELLVRVDGTTVIVSAGDTRRLAAFLARCVGDGA